MKATGRRYVLLIQAVILLILLGAMDPSIHCAAQSDSSGNSTESSSENSSENSTEDGSGEHTFVEDSEGDELIGVPIHMEPIRGLPDMGPQGGPLFIHRELWEGPPHKKPMEGPPYKKPMEGPPYKKPMEGPPVKG